MKNKKNEYLQEKTNKEGKQYAIEKFIKDCTYSDGNSKYEFVSRNVIKAVDKNEKNDYCDGILGLCFDDESDLIINFNNLEKTEKALSEKLELDLRKKSYIDTINIVNEYAQKIEESEDDLDWASKEMAERYLKIIKLIYGIKLLFTKEGKTNNIYIKDIGDINFSEMNSHILKEDPRISDPRFAINPSEEINNKVQKKVYKIILCAAKNGEEVLQDNEFVIEVRDLLINNYLNYGIYPNEETLINAQNILLKYALNDTRIVGIYDKEFINDIATSDIVNVNLGELVKSCCKDGIRSYLYKNIKEKTSTIARINDNYKLFTLDIIKHKKVLTSSDGRGKLRYQTVDKYEGYDGDVMLTHECTNRKVFTLDGRTVNKIKCGSSKEYISLENPNIIIPNINYGKGKFNNCNYNKIYVK